MTRPDPATFAGWPVAPVDLADPDRVPTADDSAAADFARRKLACMVHAHGAALAADRGAGIARRDARVRFGLRILCGGPGDVRP